MHNWVNHCFIRVSVCSLRQAWIHYENAETKRRLHNLLCVSGLTDRMSVTPIAPHRAPIAHIARFAKDLC
jgi:hypothetical protein